MTNPLGSKNYLLIFCIIVIIVWSIIGNPAIIAWIATTEFFVLRAGTTHLLRIRFYELNFEKNLSSVDSKESGNMLCISNNDVRRLDTRLDDSLEEGVYNCFQEDGRLYIKLSTLRNTPATISYIVAKTIPCYYGGEDIPPCPIVTGGCGFRNAESVVYNAGLWCKTEAGHHQGKGIITKGDIPRQGSMSKDRIVCKIVFGSFYTDYETARQVEEEEIAACIQQVPTGVTMMVFCGYCTLSIVKIVHLYILRRRPAFKYRRLASVIMSLYEVVLLIISIILTYVYSTTYLEQTPAYKAMLAGNCIILAMLIWAGFTPICQKGQKVQKVVKHKAKVWRRQPSTKAISRTLNLDVSLLTGIDVHVPSMSSEEVDAVRNLTLSLWNSDRVGKGRDARGLRHKNIKIIAVRKMETPVSSLYVHNEIILKRYASQRPNEDIKLDYKAGDPDILTRKELASQSSVLQRSVNDSINEVYLFHGTSAANISSIEREGFDVKKCTSTYLGNGLYFAESPVKADQYTGNPTSDVHTMILARVLLGNTIVLKDNIYMNNSVRPPCSSCLTINCTDDHVMKTRPFDSVILDKKPDGLFREFVVYENGMAHPAYLITYKRVQ